MIYIIYQDKATKKLFIDELKNDDVNNAGRRVDNIRQSNDLNFFEVIKGNKIGFKYVDYTL